MEKAGHRVSVRALAESVLLGGDIVRAGSAERMLEGVRGHKLLQSEYGAKALSEVSLSSQVENRLTLLTVHGRADVVWMADGVPVAVEEIKTTRRDPLSIGEDEHPVHWAQAECYAYMLCERHGVDNIEVRLTYTRPDGSARHRMARTLARGELEGRFYALAAVYIAELEAQDEWRRQRDQSIIDLPFPFESFRRGQRAMAAKAYRACKNGGRLLCEAPTGIGKTAAMLFSALKAMGEGHVGKIFYLTARGTVQRAAQEGLVLLREKGLRARSIALIAREKVCAHPGAACIPGSCPRAKGHYDRFGDARREALSSGDEYTAQYLAALCERHELCPFECALDLSLDCDVVIGDYNYAFDPFVYLRRYFMDKSDAALLIDEAHNLPDRAQSMYSAAIDRRDLEKLRREVGRVSRKAQLYTSLSTAIRAQKELAESQGDAWEHPAALAEAVDRLLNAARDALEEDAPYAGALLDVFFAAFAFSYAADLMREEHGLYAALAGQYITTLLCVKPAPLLAKTLGKVRAAVFFSATLTPLSHYRNVLGAGEEAEEQRLPSPFPRENLLVLSCPLATRYKAREQSAPAVAQAIAALCGAKTDGNYLVFFPSYAYLRGVMPLVMQHVSGARSLVQQPGMGEGERGAFLAEFSENPQGVLIAFAVMGGLFGEGVDLPGARLSGCAVVGIGLPQIGPEREALRARFNEDGEDGFACAYVYPGLSRVVQAAGRVIRTLGDRGVVLLIDERFAREDVSELLPAHWDVRTVRSPKAILHAARAFWEEVLDV